MNRIKAAQARAVQAQMIREAKIAKGGTSKTTGPGRGRPNTPNHNRRPGETMEPVNIAMPADLILGLDRMVEFGVAPNRASAARQLMHQALDPDDHIRGRLGGQFFTASVMDDKLQSFWVPGYRITVEKVPK